MLQNAVACLGSRNVTQLAHTVYVSNISPGYLTALFDITWDAVSRLGYSL